MFAQCELDMVDYEDYEAGLERLHKMRKRQAHIYENEESEDKEE